MPKDIRTCAYRAGVFAGVLGLAACGLGEPSEEDMLQALKSNVPARAAAELMMLSNPDKFKRMPTQRAVDEERAADEMMRTAVVEKASCVQAQGAPGYVCDFRMGFRQLNGQIQYGQPGKGRFFKTGAGWSFDQQ
jgi:hypothetical protein